MKKSQKMTSLALSAAMVVSMLVSVPAAAEENDAPFVALPMAAVETFNPYATSGADKIALHQVFDYLFEYDNDGNPTPCLIDSYDISEDGKIYTLNLRQDVKFHDGCGFNADDVVFSFDTMKDTDLGSTLLNAVSEVKKVDDYTVELTKGTAFSSVEKFLCDYLAIVDDDAYGEDGSSYVTSPVGTGAYKVDHIDETTSYVYLTANEDYFKGVPEVKNIEIHTPLDSSVALVALENGEVDYATMMNNSDLDIARGDDNIDVVGTDGWAQKMVILFGEPYNSDENLRKAIYYAINRENAAIYNGETEVKAAENMYADRLMGDYAGSVDMEGYDPEKAADYLSKSSYDGSTLEINVTSDMEQIAVSMQADLTAAGITSEVNLIDTNTLTSKMLDGTLGITCMDMGVAYSSPEEMMSYFTSTGFYGQSQLVATSDKTDGDIEAMKEMWNDDERKEAAVTALQDFKDLSIFFPLFSSNMYVAYNNKYAGVQPIWAPSFVPYFSQLTYAK
ncbi:MAG: ABC transporter substrate-binding protein [Blautia sp.]